jgi:alanine dehydrogenase
MRIAVAKEIKKHEYRVGMIPSGVEAFVGHGHSVCVEAGAGEGAGFADTEYAQAGASIETNKQRLFAEADMIVKVKEPLPEEYDLFHAGQLLYTYLHLAANKPLAQALLTRKITGIAYETVQLADGSLPLLTPMSEIAGRQAVQEGAKYLEKPFGGRGVLLGGVPGVQRGKVAILGGGVVGLNAARIAVGMGADVAILDISQRRLAYLADIFGNSLQTLFSTRANIVSVLRDCDVLIGAVLVTGAKAPRLVTRKDLALMRPGSVIVDVAIDQGGCVETSQPTTHDQPVYTVDRIVHYCVANMPGAVALTSTLALTNQTLMYGLELADAGCAQAVASDMALRKGVNLCRGHITHRAVAESLGLPYRELDDTLRGGDEGRRRSAVGGRQRAERRSVGA